MKTLSVGKFKARFSEVIAWIEKGEIIEVTFGKTKKVIGYLVQKKNQIFQNRREKLDSH